MAAQVKKFRKSYLTVILALLLGFPTVAQTDSLVFYFNRSNPSDLIAGERILNNYQPQDSLKIIAVANKIPLKENKVRLYSAAGNRFYQVDDYQTARFYYSKSLAYARLTLDKRLIADQQALLGDMFRLQDQNTTALTLLLQAMYIYKELGARKELSHTLSLIGDLNRCMDQYEDALKYLNEGLELALRNNYNKDKTFCYSSIGGIYQATQQYDKAIGSYEKGLAIANEMKDTMRIIDFYYSMGDLFTDQQKLDKAVEYLKKGIAFSELSGDRYYQAFCHMGLSKVYYKMKKYDASIDEGNMACKMGDEMKAFGFNAEASEILYKAYEGKGDFTNAYKYLKLVKDNNDSTMSSAKIKQQAQLEINFKNSFQEKQDSILRFSEQQKKDLVHASELKVQKIFAGIGAVGLLIVMIIAIVVYRSYKKEKRSSEIIHLQKQIVDTKNKEIVDSINYAQKIQQAVIPTDAEINSVFPNNFVMLLPKDIVSGDFYWITNTPSYSFFAVVDCTGHGVPGGFMSMLGMALLNEIVNEKKILDPADILDVLKIKIIMALRQSENLNENKDGMDIALCRFDKNKKELIFAGANNSLYLIRDQKMTEYKGDKHPIGFSFNNTHKQFTQTSILLEKNDALYMFTDGYPDQFGGPQGKKFKYKPLEQLLLQVHTNALKDQRETLLNAHKQWKGNLEQVDDICLVGIKI